MLVNGKSALDRRSTLFVFLDESGDLTFAPTGKKFFVLSAVYTDCPTRSAADMQWLKYDLLARGDGGRAASSSIEFHATNDSWPLRHEVIDKILAADNIAVHSIWLEKGKAHPVKQDLNGQIADYYSWALFRKLEAGESTAYDRLMSGGNWTVFDYFQRGTTYYWRPQEKKTTPPTG